MCLLTECHLKLIGISSWNILDGMRLPVHVEAGRNVQGHVYFEYDHGRL